MPVKMNNSGVSIVQVQWENEDAKKFSLLLLYVFSIRSAAGVTVFDKKVIVAILWRKT